MFETSRHEVNMNSKWAEWDETINEHRLYVQVEYTVDVDLQQSEMHKWKDARIEHSDSIVLEKHQP